MRTNLYQSGAMLRGMAVGVVAITVAAAQSRAGEQRVTAFQNQGVSSGFSLDFGVFGGTASAAISDTELSVAVDREAGTARMVDYLQLVDPLILPSPIGAVSTGPLTIVILPGSTGTFDEVTGQFTTQETYRIHYTNDLSALGFTNPDRFVDLPGSAQGVIDVASARNGVLDIGWDGISVLQPVPGDPSYDIEFSYSCEVHTFFAPTSAQMLDLSLIPFTANLAADAYVRDTLLAPLNQALAFLNQGRYRLAVRPMNTFIDEVESYLGTEIDDGDGTAMINTAEGTLQLLRAETLSGTK